MSYKIDYEESISSVVPRLRQEHKEIHRKLDRISKILNRKNGDLKLAVSLLKSVRPEVLRHAVEEEARLARVIIESGKEQKRTSDVERSLDVLQEHRRIKEFLDDELPFLLDENSEKEARKKIIEFTDLMIKHHREEEKELFPLALNASQTSSPKS